MTDFKVIDLLDLEDFSSEDLEEAFLLFGKGDVVDTNQAKGILDSTDRELFTIHRDLSSNTYKYYYTDEKKRHAEYHKYAIE